MTAAHTVLVIYKLLYTAAWVGACLALASVLDVKDGYAWLFAILCFALKELSAYGGQLNKADAGS